LSILDYITPSRNNKQLITPILTHKGASHDRLNVVLLIQVPLKQKKPMTYDTQAEFDAMDTGIMYCCAAAPSDVEQRWSRRRRLLRTPNSKQKADRHGRKCA
jgi:hypothetical protein